MARRAGGTGRDTAGGSVVYAADGSEYGRLERFSAAADGSECSCFAQEKGNLFTWIACLFGGSGSAAEKLAEQLLPGCTASEKLSAAKYLEQTYSTEELKSMLCSGMEFADGIYGVENAAAYYFGLSAKKLSEEQLRALADIQRSEKYRSMTVYGLKNEKAFSGLGFSSSYYCAQQFGGSYMTGVVRDLRNALSEQGMTREEADDLIFCGGMEIYTPLDRAAQEVIDGEITNVPTDEEFQLEMQIMDYSGNVTACTGGIDKGDRIDHTQKLLSPGSSVKPLSVYAPLIEERLAAYSTLLPDIPYSAQNEWPKHFDYSVEGEVTLAKAVRRSKNTCAVFGVDMLTPEKCAEYLRNAGLVHISDEDVSFMGMGLGYMDSGVTLCEMNAAYAAFGNGGYYYEPTFVTSAKKDGETIYEHVSQPKQVFSAETAWIMNRLLKSNVDMQEGLGTQAALEGTAVFGKTGTTDVNDVIDNNWFVGGTPDKVAAAWAGLDDPRQNNGMPACTRLWKLIIEQLDSPTPEFTPCGDCISAEFCTKTGLLSSDGCESTEEGWYTSDNISEKCGECS